VKNAARFHKCRCADMLRVYGFRDGSATAVEEYCRRFPMCRIPNHRLFCKVFNTLRECGMFPIAHVSSERVHQ
jgi:hypothetical protein